MPPDFIAHAAISKRPTDDAAIPPVHLRKHLQGFQGQPRLIVVKIHAGLFFVKQIGKSLKREAFFHAAGFYGHPYALAPVDH